MISPYKAVILVIDDNANNLGILFDYLRPAGYKVLLAQDGKSAIQQIRYQQPDMVLLDIFMPGLDGFDTCRQLREQKGVEDIPIIVLTVLSENEGRKKAFQAGATDYITKPIGVEELLTRLDTHLKIRNLQKNTRE